ncbi:hypothetical protein JXA88_17545 [Candidatus Fermentibacteria bacterium]|nr:hypothetical protein [Candidatus Fermentibacteria bacterium]
MRISPMEPGRTRPREGLTTRRILWAMVILALCAHAVVLVRTAWVHDDAFITMRTVSNLLGGHGMTYNAGERVQTYTHPLWMLVMTAAYGLTREPFYTLIALGGLLSLIALGIVALKLASSPYQAVLIVTLATTSKALTDYSTSGLENPLVHVLLVLFASTLFLARPSNFGRLALLAGLAVWTRPDAGLLVAPALVCAFMSAGPRRGKRLLMGLSPLIAWMAFQIWYYGFPFPNTAYAKLGAGIPALSVAQRGLWYLWNSLLWDPLTLLTLAAGVVGAWVSRQRALGVGILLYLAYVVRAGGDFMSGRFLTPPLFMALIVLARLSMSRPRALLAAGLILTVSLSTPRSPLLSGRGYGREGGPPQRSLGGICDERAYYYQSWGLLTVPRGTPFQDRHRAAVAEGLSTRRVMWRKGVGFAGFFHAGPHDYVIDAFALTSPLLARLPAAQDQPWLVGHIKRWIPSGYFESLRTGENLIHDENLRQFYDRLRIITQGSLTSVSRLGEIVRMNTGAYRHLVAQPRHYDVPIGLLARVHAPATTWEAVWECPIVPEGSVGLILNGRTNARGFDIRLSGEAVYGITLLRGGVETYSIAVGAPGSVGVPESVFVEVPPEVVVHGYEMVRVRPLGGTGHAVSDLRLME